MFSQFPDSPNDGENSSLPLLSRAIPLQIPDYISSREELAKIPGLDLETLEIVHEAIQIAKKVFKIVEAKAPYDLELFRDESGKPRMIYQGKTFLIEERRESKLILLIGRVIMPSSTFYGMAVKCDPTKKGELSSIKDFNGVVHYRLADTSILS